VNGLKLPNVVREFGCNYMVISSTAAALGEFPSRSEYYIEIIG